MAPPYLQVVALSFLGAVLGLAAMIPLRRLLIVRATTSCLSGRHRVRRGAAGDGRRLPASAWIFRGMALGAAIKTALSLAFLMPAACIRFCRCCRRPKLAMELAPALLGVGFILGYRQSGVLVAGSLVSALVLTPLIAWIGTSLTAPLAPETTKLVSRR